MKHAKKLISFLLTLVMVLAVSTTAFAAGSGSITVDNPVEGATYTAYKIFDVTYNEGKTAYSYTIAGDSEWFDVVAAVGPDGTVSSKIAGLTFTKASSENTYIVTKGAEFSAPGFANTLKQNIPGKTGTTLAIADGKATASNLDLGYYLVVGTKGAETEALANLTTTDPDVTIHDKNDMPFDKIDDKESVDVGETVTYTITGKVPDTTGFTEYTYEFSDTMSDGLTFNKDVVVKIGDKDITNKAHITYDVGGNPNSFKASVPVMDYQDQIGAVITVTYTAKVNENAAGRIEKNHADLTYSNDPTNTESKETTPPDEETVYSAKIVIDKYEAGNEEKKLAGAEFVLYKLENGNKQYYKYVPATETEVAKVEWVDDIKDATHVTTDESGVAHFDGLKDGTYYLEEIKAPAGYNLLPNPAEVVINGGNATVENMSSLTVTAKVANNTGSELPSTGGMGTTIFYVLGSILLVGAAVLLITKKRMNNNK